MTMGIQLVPLPVTAVPLRGGPVALATAGDPGAPVALFVPGYTGSKEDFALLAAPVTAAGFRYVAMDQRGQYESPGPDDPAAYTVDALAAELLELIDRLGPPVHLVGHSFGGLVARAATIRAAPAVRSLVLLDSGPAGLSGPRVDAMELLRPVLDRHGMPGLFDALVGLRPDAPAGAVLAFLRHRFVVSSEAGLRAMGEELKTEPDRTAELAATGVPAFVVFGEHDDAWTPAIQRDMAARLGVRYAEIPGAVHSPAAEAPRATAELLVRFWRSL